MIYHITPWHPKKRYGKAINKHIECLPDDAWICLRDMDTMFLTPGGPAILESAIEDHPDATLFTCATNRAYRQQMMTERDIVWHYHEAVERSKKKSYSITSGVLPAFLWLFPRRVWVDHPFDNYPIIWRGNSFDTRWVRQLRGRKMRINHLYLFHYYRLHKNNHKDHSHLA